MKTLTEKFHGIKEGRYAKAQFLRDARLTLPNLITQFNSFDDAVSILKSKGMISEAKVKENTPAYTYVGELQDRFPLEAIERGIDIELEKMGITGMVSPSEEDYKKAKKKTLKNLEKDLNFYLHKIAGKENSSKTTDKMEVISSSNLVDKKNKMSKVKMNESKNFNFTKKEDIKEVIKNLIVKLLKEETTPPDSNKKRFNLEGKIY